jgi:non-ribosomal peptide synthetase component F
VHRSLVVPPTIVDGLRELARHEGCTLSTTLFAALNALLYEATGQQDIRVNIPLAARTRPEVEGLIGCFRKRLILRTDVSGRPTLRQLLVRAKDVLNAAHLHQDVPPDVVFPDRGVDHPAHKTKVHAAFNFFQSTDDLAGSLTLPGLSTTVLERSQYNGKSIFDMSVFERQNGISLLLRSMRELFSPDAIQRILEDYVTILKRIVSKPDERINHAAAGDPWSHAERVIGD